MSSNLNVFISYAREDGREYADRLYRAFNERGISAWRDERNINPYQDFSGEIEKAIEESTHVVACLTPSIAQRKDSFVRREILYAQGWEKPITPLLMPGFDKRHIPTLINHLTWMEFQEFGADFPTLLQRLGQEAAFVPSAQQDPFQDYLHALYKDVVSFLDSTVFSLITLHSEATPEVVKPREVRARALPMGFKGLAVKQETSLPEQSYFDSFHNAYDYYDGRLLLLGDPGAGKTTTLMAFAREAIAQRLDDSTLPLPIIAPVASYVTGSGLSLSGWLASLNPYLGAPAIDQLLQQGKLLLLLDGLDELESEYVITGGASDEITGQEGAVIERFDPRKRFLENLAQLNPANKVLVTCRIKDFDEINTQVSLKGAITLQPLDDEQMAEYLRDQPALLSAIQMDEGLREMSRTPLLLSLLTYAYAGLGAKTTELGDLSKSPGELRWEIFSTYIQRRYEREQMRSSHPPAYSLEAIYEVLGQVFFYYTTKAIKTSLKRRMVFNGTEFSVRENDTFVELVQRLHLIVPVRPKVYRFIHLLLRDHFLLAYCRKMLHSPDINQRAEAAQGLSLVKDSLAVEALIESINDPDPIVRATSVKSLSTLAEVASDTLMELFDSTTNPRMRQVAVSVLSRSTKPPQGDWFLNLLSDSDDIIRRLAVEALYWWHKSDEVVTALMGVATEDNNLWVRDSALRVLAKSQNVRAVEILADALWNSRYDNAKFDAMKTLKKMPHEQIREPILRVAEQVVNYDILRDLLPLLGELGDMRAVPILKTHSQMYESAKAALKKLGYKEET